LKTLEKNTVNSKKTARFLVLLPHRDSLKLLQDYKLKLFAGGYKGALSFPPVAPLAVLSRCLNREELKKTAHVIRDASLKNNGKITAGKNDFIQSPELCFFGPILDLQCADLAAAFPCEKIIKVFPKTLLCAALADASGLEQFPAEPEPFSFGAAMVTNLVIRPLASGASAFSFEWRLGPECWLPGR